MSKSKTMVIHFINHEQWGIDLNDLKPVVDKLCRTLPKHEGELMVIFVDDKEIHRLNKSYRHKDKPTDVLSFSYIDSRSENDPTLGEILISVPTARKQAPDYGNTLSQEIQKLLVHGTLHVFGYDHETDSDFKTMSAMERTILGR